MAERKERITYIDPEKLIPYEYNAREHGSEVEFLKNSINEFGFRNPILVDANNVIIAGHGRRIAAMELGLKKVPCIVCEDLTPEQVRALRVADNKMTDLSSIAWDNLNYELGALKELGWDMQNFGFEDMGQFDEPMEEPETAEEYVVEDISSAEPSGAGYRLMVTCDTESEREEVMQRLIDMGVSYQIMG